VIEESFEEMGKKKVFQVANSLDYLFSKTDLLTENINNYLLNSVNKLDHKAVEQLINTHADLFFFERLYFITEHQQRLCVNEIVSDEGNRYTVRPIRKEIDLVWLKKTFLSSGHVWHGVVFDSIQEKRVICKSLPLSFPERSEPVYLIALYSVDQIYQYLQESGLNKIGVPYMVDSTSHFIAHPLNETRSLLDLGRDYNDQALTKLGHDVINRSPDNKTYIHTNTVTGLRCMEVIHYIPHMNNWLGVSVYNGESLESKFYQTETRRFLIRMMLYGMVLIVVIYLLCRSWLNIKGSYLLHIYSTLLFFLLTVSVISIYNRYPQNEKHRLAQVPDKSNVETWKWDSLRIVDKETLNQLIDDYQHESLIVYNEQAKMIPTGIYIYDVQFANSHEVKVSGVVWQKYLKEGVNYPRELAGQYMDNSYDNKGIFFPGSRTTKFDLTDSLEVTMGHYPAILYRWEFDIDIGQMLSYSLYPFGKSEISLPIWSRDLDYNTLLVPDLEAYKQIYPTNLPGMDPHSRIKGWNLLSSHYSYSYDSYLCNFGNRDMYGVNNFPELMFNISISRKFVDILVCKIVPLMVILTLLFTLIFIRKKEDGFNNVIGCSGLFFVLVLDHINLRETVLSENIMYLEFCYFISYIILLLVTITSFDTESATGPSGYSQKLDHVLKHYYWSIILGAMAIVTICYFY